MTKIIHLTTGVGSIGEGQISFNYKFLTDTTPPPGDKFDKLNNADPTLATKMYISVVNDEGADIGDLLRVLTNVGDHIVQFSRTDAGQRLVYLVTAITDQTTYIEYDVTYVSSAGLAFANNAKIVLAWFASGAAGGGDMLKVNYASASSTIVDAALSVNDGIGNSKTALQVVSHIDDATLHFTEASIDHAAILNIGTNTHAQIDTHIADATLHFTEASIDHTAILNIGTNTHAQIDTHLALVTGNPHAVKEEEVDGARLTNAAVTTTQSLDWDVYKVFEFTMTGNTTFSDSNLPTGTNTRVIEMIITGDFTLTLPTYYEALPSNDTYDGTKRNHLVISCIVGTAASEDVIYSLQTLTT